MMEWIDILLKIIRVAERKLLWACISDWSWFTMGAMNVPMGIVFWMSSTPGNDKQGVGNHIFRSHVIKYEMMIRTKVKIWWQWVYCTILDREIARQQGEKESSAWRKWNGNVTAEERQMKVFKVLLYWAICVWLPVVERNNDFWWLTLWMVVYQISLLKSKLSHVEVVRSAKISRNDPYIT